MEMQNVKNLDITEGSVKTIHDKNNQLLWGAVGYDTKYVGDTYQRNFDGYNLIDLVPITNMAISASDQCTTEIIMDSTLGKNVLHIVGNNNYPTVVFNLPKRLESGKYYALKFTYRSAITVTGTNPNLWFAPSWTTNNWDVASSIAGVRCKSGDGDTLTSVPQSTTWKTTSRRFYVDPTQYSNNASYNRICFSLAYNTYESQPQGKEVWLADAEIYEITQAEWDAETYASKEYLPYCGGIPAPNPSFPMPVNVVTGAQTITISDGTLSKDFTVDLGNTELCKIGNYQDYIYKSGDDWYAHKGNGKVILNGTEDWLLGQSLTDTSHFVISDFTTIFIGAAVPPNDTILGYCLSDHFDEKANLYNIDQVGIDLHANKNLIVSVPNSISTTTANFKTWLSTHNTTVYYALATSTDTKITDTTLISQLDAIHEWLTRYGYTPTVSGNLPLIINQTNLT